MIERYDKMKKLDRITLIVIIMKTLIEILEGREFESEENLLDFRDLVAETGLDPLILYENTPLKCLQIVASEFSKINFEEGVIEDGSEQDTTEILQEQSNLTETVKEGESLPIQVPEEEP